jgi:hypothetical protein
MRKMGYSTSHFAKVVPCTVDQLNQALDSAAVNEVCGQIAQALLRVKQGEMSRTEFENYKKAMKSQLPVLTPHAVFKNGERKNSEAIPSGLSMYDIDHIVNHLDSEASRPYPIDPIGRWWVYAWVRNIGPGEKYAIGSDITGGLFVGAANGGAVRTGCIKWGKPVETQNIFGHVPEYRLADDAKEQCIYINGVGRGPFGPSGNDNDKDHVGHFGGGTYPTYSSGMRDTDITNSALQIKAIGYCKAAYNQITTDEVVDNIKWLSRQYCSNS